MTTSLKGLRKMADFYRPRMRDRDEAAGVDEVVSVDYPNRRSGMKGMGKLAMQRTLSRPETDRTMRDREYGARQREKHR